LSTVSAHREMVKPADHGHAKFSLLYCLLPCGALLLG
jgi:hypothetical protein